MQELYTSLKDTYGQEQVYAGLGLVGLSSVYLLKKFFNGGVNKHFPSLQGKVIIITGANAGMGLICAKEFAKLGAKAVVMACRDNTRGQNAVLQVRNELNVTNVEFMKLDLNDLESVQTFAQEFKKKYDKLDILLNNAGIMALPKRSTTKQGYEKQIGVNHLGHFLLTNLLNDRLSASGEARVVNLSSKGHIRAPNSLNFDDLMMEKSYTPLGAYQASKLANIYFTRQLAQLMKLSGQDHKIKTVSLHPGSVRTDLANSMLEGKWLLQFFMKVVMSPVVYLVFKSPWQGAQTSLHCCLCPFQELQSGLYYSDCAVKQETLNPKWAEEAEKLQQWSAKAVQKFAD